MRKFYSAGFHGKTIRKTPFFLITKFNYFTKEKLSLPRVVFRKAYNNEQENKHAISFTFPKTELQTKKKIVIGIIF